MLAATAPADQAIAPAAPVAPAVEGPAPAPPPAPSSEIVVSARAGPPPGDPLQGVNAVAFEATQKVDDALVAPAARAYKSGLPRPVRLGLRNFLRNLDEPIVAFNFLIQLKIGKAFETIGRMAINTTIGVGGLVDMAKKKPFNLPFRKNSFATTLGYYGVKPGAFLFLPLIGPTTVRDLVGTSIDRLLWPASLGKPFTSREFTVPAGVSSALQYRLDSDKRLKEVRSSGDPYASARKAYLDRRAAEVDAIRTGALPPEAAVDADKEEPETTPAPAPAPALAPAP